MTYRGGLMGWSDGSHMRQGGNEAATGRALTSVCHTPPIGSAECFPATGAILHLRKKEN